MSTAVVTPPAELPPVVPTTAAAVRLKFDGNNEFHSELRRRVMEYFQTTGKSQRDCPQMYVKTAVILGTFALSYYLLVAVVTVWWLAVPLALLLGAATAGIGFNIQHDGGHHGYSSRDWVNKLAALSLDMIGGSSYLWHEKHAVFHHTYTNITEQDTDIDVGPIARMSPHLPRLWLHRFQHLYIWPLYGFMAIRWHFHGDYRDVVLGKVGDHQIKRPTNSALAVFIIGKLIFLFLAFGLPLLLGHRWWVVLLFYALVASTLGILMAVVFQLAHCVDNADFPMPNPQTGRMDNAWAVHQIATTVDFARGSKLAAWYLGGLNFQVEHHLFPRICHVNYPALSQLVEETCRDFGVQFRDHGTFLAGVVSHYRYLQHLGQPEAR